MTDLPIEICYNDLADSENYSRNTEDYGQDIAEGGWSMQVSLRIATCVKVYI